MAKEEKAVDYAPQEFEINDEESLEMTELEKPVTKASVTRTAKKPIKAETQLVSCLRNERVIVRHIPKQSGMVTNPKHILYGGMAENAKKTFVVPRLSSGVFVNVLTDSEKAYLEEIMGLEYNALSVYKRPESENYWNDGNDTGISRVTLGKDDNYLNLADPEDYIRYKILLANKDFIAPSMQALEDSPKETYQFVIIAEGEETKMAKNNMSYTMRCYKEFGKVEEDADTLRTIIELIDGRPTSPHSKLEFLQTKANNLIQADSKLFLRVITDPLLSTKVLIKKAIAANLISNRGNYLYMRNDNSPLCESNEEPTLNIAAKYLNSPKHQEIKFGIEAKLK
jgi:hypothetical protein